MRKRKWQGCNCQNKRGWDERPRDSDNMKTPVKTERGWELADESGILEAEAESLVYANRQLALQAASAPVPQAFDELAAMERRYDSAEP